MKKSRSIMSRQNGRPNVVIVVGGFGGLYAAKGLANRPVSVTLVDRKNHHTFQPLLYQVATSVLSPGEIATPLRHTLYKAKNVEVILGEVTGFDTAARRVLLDGVQPHELNHALVLALCDAHLLRRAQLLETRHACEGVAVIAGVIRRQAGRRQDPSIDLSRDLEAGGGVGREFADRPPEC